MRFHLSKTRQNVSSMATCTFNSKKIPTNLSFMHILQQSSTTLRVVLSPLIFNCSGLMPKKEKRWWAGWFIIFPYNYYVVVFSWPIWTKCTWVLNMFRLSESIRLKFWAYGECDNTELCVCDTFGLCNSSDFTPCHSAQNSNYLIYNPVFADL